VEHDGMNVLVLGGLVVARALAHDLVQTNLGTPPPSEDHGRGLDAGRPGAMSSGP
jgi:ribose 5-phosphate isomerase RpiB